MFDRGRSSLKIEDVDANAAIFNIVNTFKLKVEKYVADIARVDLQAQGAFLRAVLDCVVQKSVRKSPTMLQQISTVINDETKRLRFQVEKVLQMSMFDRGRSSLKIEDVDGLPVFTR